MSEEEKQIMNKMIYCNLVSGEQALKFNNHIKEILQENEQLKDQLQQKENIIKEVREYINENEDYFYNYPLVNREHLLEILEEDKKIEKLEIVHNGSPNAYALLNEYGTKCALTKHSKVMCDKINEIIDKLNEMEKE